MDNMTIFPVLLDRHLEIQSGCYFSEIETGPSEMRYAWSSSIPDTAWNFATFTDLLPSTAVEWVIKTAFARQRTPALLVPEDFEEKPLISHPNYQESLPERWMTFSSDQKLMPDSGFPNLSVKVTNSPKPEKDFLMIFENLFESSQLNEHFSKHYVPALANAREVSGVTNQHFVGYLDNRAVCCASIYMTNTYAGLYNVGTLFTEQKKGLGRAISIYSMQQAVSQGCSTIFLQCEVGTHVESLYKSIGFDVTSTPAAIVFHA